MEVSRIFSGTVTEFQEELTQLAVDTTLGSRCPSFWGEGEISGTRTGPPSWRKAQGPETASLFSHILSLLLGTGANDWREDGPRSAQQL